jgi:hypothetical protein
MCTASVRPISFRIVARSRPLFSTSSQSAKQPDESRTNARSSQLLIPKIPWAQMRGMRNRMAHGYFDIDLNIVWDTLQSSLPDLERLLQNAAAPIKP